MSEPPHVPESSPAGGRTYGGLTAEERHSHRRTKLLDVGLQLFAEQGFAKTGVRDLCRTSRISERAFYDAVGSREQLLKDVYLRATDDVIADIAQAMTHAPIDFTGRLRAGLEAFFESIQEDPRRGKIIYVEALGRGEEIEETRREGLERFVTLVLAGLDGYLPEESGPPAASLEAAVSAAIIAIGEIAYRLTEGEDAYTGAQAAQQFTTALVATATAFGLRV